MKIDFTPTKKQYIAYNYLTDSKTNEILYWGWARWGKSYLGASWITMECLTKPWSAWLVWRSELKRLRQTTLVSFFEVFKAWWITDKQYNYNKVDSVMKFYNGSTIYFVDLGWQPSDPNYDRLGSFGLTWLWIDEAQEVDATARDVLRARFSLLYGKDGYDWKTIPKALYTCNPWPWWIKKDFYVPHKEGWLPDDRVFVQSLVTDNPYIPDEYIENLKKSENKVQIERLLYGNFDYDDTEGKLYHYDDIMAIFTNPWERGRKYITCDVARMGKDKTVILVWSWYTVIDYKVINKSGLDVVANEIVNMSVKYSINIEENVICDEDWVGWGIVDFLWCLWFVNNSSPISPYWAKQNQFLKRNYQNLKTQAYFALSGPIKERKLRISTDDHWMKKAIIEELDIVCQVDFEKENKIKIIPKEEIKEKLWRSPDYSDALAMRMFFELRMVPETTGEYIYQEPEFHPYKEKVKTITDIFELPDDGVSIYTLY